MLRETMSIQAKNMYIVLSRLNLRADKSDFACVCVVDLVLQTYGFVISRRVDVIVPSPCS